MPFKKGNTEGRKSRLNKTPEENCASAQHARSFITPEIQAAASSAGGRAAMSANPGIHSQGGKVSGPETGKRQGAINAESGHMQRITGLLEHSTLGKWSAHVRWHTNRSIVNELCEHCRTGKPPDSFKYCLVVETP